MERVSAADALLSLQQTLYSVYLLLLTVSAAQTRSCRVTCFTSTLLTSKAADGARLRSSTAAAGNPRSSLYLLY